MRDLAIEGESAVGLAGYVDQILCSGLPGVRALDPRRRPAALRAYLAEAASSDLARAQMTPRRPDTVLAWIAALARASSHTTPLTQVHRLLGRSLASRDTVTAWRDALTQTMLLDPVPAWMPTGPDAPGRLTSSPRLYLADPALAAAACQITSRHLLRGQTAPVQPVEGTWLAALFSSLVTMSVRTYAEAHGWNVSHLRTKRGTHDIPLIIELDGSRVLAGAITTSPDPSDRDTADLTWLADTMPRKVAGTFVITTGPAAYRRDDGVAIIPLALLAP